MKSRRRVAVQDAGVIGWISISEVFLLCGVTMLTVALAVESRLDRTRNELAVIKKAESDVPALRQAIAGLEQQRRQDLQAIKTVTDRLALADQKAQKLADQAASLGLQLKTALAEKKWLGEALTARSMERDKLAADLVSREAELVRVRTENDSLRMERLAFQDQIRKLRDQLARIDESIVMPLKAAKLIVKIRCEALPTGYDLDLYVQDPHDQVCSWVQPRTLWETNETGLLILSEDLRNLRNTTEEIYYSLTIEPSDLDHPYLVFCMLRAKSSDARPGPLDVPVEWEVSMAWKDSLEPIGKGVRRIKTPGKVVYANRTYGYPGLVPLTGFRRASNPNEKPRVMGEQGIPRIFRGWSDSNVATDAASVIKVRDN
jgi:hypothetical protein